MGSELQLKKTKPAVESPSTGNRDMSRDVSLESCPPIVFFDGPCALCQASVQWLRRHEQPAVATGDVLRFAPLQGETARALLPVALRTEPLDEVVFRLSGGETLTGAAAVRALSGWLRLGPAAWLMKATPLWAYRAVARRRLRVWGRRADCAWSPEVAARMLP
jgi:predicted DCC family thiol-disulfide oxidoreductase YuxK